MLVMELWLSRAFSSSGSAFGSRTGDRCRFAGLNTGVFLFGTARLLSTGFLLLSTRFFFLGKNLAPNLTGFLFSIFSISVITRRYTLYLLKRKQASRHVCVLTKRKSQMTYLSVFTPSSPKVLKAVLKMDSRAASSIASHASCRRIMSRLEIMLFVQSPA